MRYIPALLLSSVLVQSAAAEESPLTRVATGLSKIAEDMEPVAAVEQNGRVIDMSHNTRVFLVHASDRLGRRSENTHEAVGPRHDGLVVRVTVQDGRYAGAAVIPQDLRGPYWTTFVNAYSISDGKQHLHVNISYGGRTDRKVISRIKDLLASVADDSPGKPGRSPAVSTLDRSGPDNSEIMNAIRIATSAAIDQSQYPAKELKLISAQQMVIKGKYVWRVTFKPIKLLPKDPSKELIGAGGEIFVNVDPKTKKPELRYGE